MHYKLQVLFQHTFYQWLLYFLPRLGRGGILVSSFPLHSFLVSHRTVLVQYNSLWYQRYEPTDHIPFEEDLYLSMVSTSVRHSTYSPFRRITIRRSRKSPCDKKSVRYCMYSTPSLASSITCGLFVDYCIVQKSSLRGD